MDWHWCTLEGNPAGMWCSLCRTDVSVRTTGHAGGLLCSRCGHDLLSASRPNDAIRQAREILERWNSSDLFERISRTESLDALHTRMDAVKKSDAPKQLLSAKLLESASPEKARTAQVVINELPPEACLSETPSGEMLNDSVASQRPDGSLAAAALPDAGDIIPDANDASTAEEDIAGSEASPQAAAGSSEPTHEHETDTPLPSGEVAASRTTADTAMLPELTHTDVLSVTTVTNAKVTGKGITNELQRVMDWARAHHVDPMGMTEDDASESDSGAYAVAEVSHATDLTQSLQSASAAGMVSHADSELSPPKPAETANTSELVSAAEPKKNLRSPMRRPLLHRRFQLERPATTSSTGSENVNRKLRVDLPGGSNVLPEAAAAAQHNASIASSVAPETKIVSNASGPGGRIRIDGPESVDAVTGTDGRRGRTQPLPKHRYIDDAHDSSLRGPHFEITAPRRSNLTSVTGQFLAYLGVLGLTIGTAMVIYGHFGGYSEYTPTGWLVTTVAQMLLFLGVINLVSGGIEQNNDEVSRRINTLGEQLLRIEQVTSDAMKGPKLSPRLYDNPNADVEETSRETAGINRE
ncbi:MAG: hypothetical protein WKF77_02925 [Planctomycetaceae bacterium]